MGAGRVMKWKAGKNIPAALAISACGVNVERES
jgi:hypothetical protein